MSTLDELRIVMAEDDEDDQVLARDALREVGVVAPLDFVEDGAELLAYLRRAGGQTDTRSRALPVLVVLDLNMPRMNGHEALAAIRADEQLRHLPVVVLTTSKRDEDVLTSYRLGANAYLTKPNTFQGMVEMMQTVCDYWLRVVRLPRTTQS